MLGEIAENTAYIIRIVFQFRIQSFQSLGFRVLGFGVLGFGVLGFRMV